MKNETRAEWWAQRFHLGMEIAGRDHTTATHSLQEEAAHEAVRLIEGRANATKLQDTDGNPLLIGHCDRYLFTDGSELIVADVNETAQTMIVPLREADAIWKHLPATEAKVIVLGPSLEH